jgi:hypothetical protein
MCRLGKKRPGKTLKVYANQIVADKKLHKNSVIQEYFFFKPTLVNIARVIQS